MSTDIVDHRVELTAEQVYAESIKSDYPVTGIVALEQGLISQDQFETALQYCKSQKKTGCEITFEDALIKMAYLSADSVAKLIVKSIRRMGKDFCEIAVEKGYVAPEHAENALKLQAKKYQSGELVILCDFFIKAGLMTPSQRDTIYSLQNKHLTEKFYQYENSTGESDNRIPPTALSALTKKIITPEQVVETLEYCEREKKAGREISFEDALLEKQIVTPDVLMKLIAVTIRNMNVSLGEKAVETGFVSQKYIDSALKIQAEKFKNGELILIGDLLINAGLLTKEKRDGLLEVLTPEELGTGVSEDFKESHVYKSAVVIGELAVAYSFISGKEFETGLKYLKKAYTQGLKVSFDRILLEKGFLDEKEAALLNEIRKFLNTRDLDIQFAAIAVEDGHLTRRISRAMLKKQLEVFDEYSRCVTLAAIVVEEQLMTVEHCNILLKKQGREQIQEGNPASDVTETPKLTDTPEVDSDSEGEAQPPTDIEIDSGVLLTVTGDSLEAIVKIPAGHSDPVTIEDIKKLLDERRIVFGIADDSDIEETLLLGNAKERQIVVARGEPVVMGRDAELIVNFQREYLNPGKITEDGMIDFRDRGAVPYTATGDTLVEIIPEKEGQPGRDIFGQVVSPPPVEGVTIIPGKGTELSDDGLKILATGEGQPSMTVTGEVSVFEEFIVAGDVDFNTGNIVFNGHITVKGTIREGFSVSGGSLTVKEIDGGSIDLKGNLEVSGGVLNSVIKAEGNVQAMYMADTYVVSYNDVIIKKEIIGSTILTSGACKSEGTTIITSTIAALNGISAAEIGTDVSERCILKVGVYAHAENEIRIIKEALDQKIESLADKQAGLAELEKEQVRYQDLISEAAQIQDRGGIKLKELKEQLANTGEEIQGAALKVEIRDLETRIRDAESAISGYFDHQDDLMTQSSQAHEECETVVAEIEKHNLAIKDIQDWAKKQKKDPVVKATKNIYQGTLIFGPATRLSVKEVCRNSSIKEVDGDTTKGESKRIMKIIPN